MLPRWVVGMQFRYRKRPPVAVLTALIHFAYSLQSLNCVAILAAVPTPHCSIGHRLFVLYGERCRWINARRFCAVIGKDGFERCSEPPDIPHESVQVVKPMIWL